MRPAAPQVLADAASCICGAFSKESYDSPRTVDDGKSYFPSARLAYYFDERQVTAVRRHGHLVWNVALCVMSSKDLAIGAGSRISDHDAVPHGGSPAILDPNDFSAVGSL